MSYCSLLAYNENIIQFSYVHDVYLICYKVASALGNPIRITFHLAYN